MKKMGIILAVLTVFLIFFFSSQSHKDTKELSCQVVDQLYRIGIEIEPGPLRHYAHYLEYGALGLVLALLFRWHALWIGLLVGLADEVFKYFRPGREFELSDLLRDFAAIAFMTLIVMRFRKRKEACSRRNSQGDRPEGNGMGRSEEHK